MTDLKPGIYQHYKGSCYEVIGVATHTETLEQLVTYYALDEKTGARRQLYVRPQPMFLETVVVEGKEVPRFTYRR